MKHTDVIAKRNAVIFDGMEIQLIRSPRESASLSTDAVLFYVIAGGIRAAAGKSWELGKKDILLFNIGQSFSVDSGNDALALRVRFTGRKLAQAIPDGRIFFACNSVDDRTHSYDELEEILQRIVFSFVGKQKHTESLQSGLLYLLLDQLAEYFRPYGLDAISQKTDRPDEQVRSMIGYVSRHFETGIRLRDLADEMYTSAATLSRLFKKQTGMYFGDFVNRVRLEAASRELRETAKGITAAAYDSGFTNMSSFNRNFQKYFGMAPREYRKSCQNEMPLTGETEEWSEIETQIREMNEQAAQLPAGRVDVAADVRGGAPYERFWAHTMNVGAVYNLTAANMQKHVLFLKSQLRFRYARIWNIFSAKMMLRGGPDSRNYNFMLVDQALDFLIENGLVPFIDLGSRPEEALASESERVYHERSAMEFGGMEDWERTIDAFLSHILRRYGRENVRTWKFDFFVYEMGEFSFLRGGAGEHELYAACCRALRRRIPEAEFGGRGFMAYATKEQIAGWLRLCAENSVMPDFLSFEMFPYIQNQENGRPVRRRNPKMSQTEELAVFIKKTLAKTGHPDCRLYITEWNVSLSNRNYLNDSCARAAFFLQMVMNLWGVPDSLSVWMGSDWISAYYDTAGVAYGGSGILTKDGIRKPLFYALRFLNQMGKLVVDCGSNYLVTRDEEREHFYILCHNARAFSPEYFLREEDSVAPSELPEMFKDGNRLEMSFSLTGLPEGRQYRIREEYVSPGNGSLLEAWGRFQYERELESGDIRYLRETCIPTMTMQAAEESGGAMRIDAVLDAHEILLIHVFCAD